MRPRRGSMQRIGRANAGGPHHRCGDAARVPSWRTTPASSAEATSVSMRTSTPRRSSSRCAYRDSLGAKVGRTRSPPSSSTMRTSDGANSGYSSGSTSRTSSASAPAYSTPVGPPPTMQNVSSRRRSFGSVEIAAALEAVEHVVAQLQGLSEILETERAFGDRVVAVVVGGAAGREHAVRRTAAWSRRRAVRCCAAKSTSTTSPWRYRTFGASAEHLAQRRGDLRRVQQAARNLVQQRREQVVVVPVDDGDVDRSGPRASSRTAARRTRHRR